MVPFARKHAGRLAHKVGLPAAEQVGLELVFARHLGGALLSAEHLEDDPRLELCAEVTTLTHGCTLLLDISYLINLPDHDLERTIWIPLAYLDDLTATGTTELMTHQAKAQGSIGDMGGMVTVADSSWLSKFSGAGNTSPTSQQLYKAFVLLSYDFGYDEMREGALSYLADFTQRWGKPSPDNLLAIARRFAPGQPRPASDVEANGAAMDDVALGGPDTPEEADTTFALAILGVMRLPEVSAALVPYLTSPYAIERWLAALGLAAIHDERALPALGRMLVEFIGPNQPEGRESVAGYHAYQIQTLRSYLPQALADWGDPRLVPLVRTALIATVQAEEIELHEPHGPEQAIVAPGGRRFVGWEAWEWFRPTQRQWMKEEHQLVYALGRLGAFGALAGVPTRPGIYYYWEPSTVYVGDETGEVAVEVEPSRNDHVAESRAAEFRGAIWRVHACCGFLEPQFRDRLTGVTNFADAPEFAEAIERLLEGQFGLDEVERRQAMEDYDRTSYVNGTLADYRRFARQAKDEEAEHEEGQARDERD